MTKEHIERVRPYLESQVIVKIGGHYYKTSSLLEAWEAVERKSRLVQMDLDEFSSAEIVFMDIMVGLCD